MTTKPEARETILQEAQRLVHGDRHDHYGHPSIDFDRAACIFNSIRGKGLEARDVAYVLLSVKLARHQHREKRDNLTDAAGYIECLARVEGHDP